MGRIIDENLSSSFLESENKLRKNSLDADRVAGNSILLKNSRYIT